MNDAQLTAIIIGLTGILRTRFPKLDGIVVPVVSMVLGAGLSVLSRPDVWREGLIHGIGIGLSGVGGMTALGYAGSKLGAAFGAKDAAPSPTETAAPNIEA